MTLLDLREGQSLEDAETALAQCRVGANGQPNAGAQHVCGIESAMQIARIDGVERVTGQRQRQAPGLPAAGVVQADVALALDARVDVPGRLAVADGENARGAFGHPSNRRLRV